MGRNEIFPFPICLTFLALSSSCWASESNTKVHKVHQYLEVSISLINKFIGRLPNCEILFTWESSSLEEEEVDLISSNFAKFLKHSHAGVFNVQVNPSKVKEVRFKRFEDIHKLGKDGSCTHVILLINEMTPTLPRILFNLLTPAYTSISRKDEDYFFFLSSSSSVLDKLLMSTEFGNKIKFKLGIGPSSGLGKGVEVKTVDFYRTLAGPEVVSFEVHHDDPEVLNWFPDFTLNYRGFPLKLAIPKAPFRFELEKREDGRYHPKRGTYKPWLDMAMEKFNFTYNCFYSSYGGGTGIKFPNGSWVGAVADVRDNVADMAYFIAHIYNRHEVVDWSAPLSYEWIVFVSHKPRFFYSNWAIFWPFAPIVWAFFLVSIICVAICVKVISSKIGVLMNSEKIARLWTLPKSLEYIYTTFVEQDRQGPASIPYAPIRILCLTWLLFALVTANAYRAKLVSVMAFPVSTFVPTTYEELVDSHFGAGMHVIGKGDAAYTIFQVGRGRVYEGIFARLQTGFSSPLQCLLKAVHEDFGCLMWEGLNDYLNVKNISHGRGHVPTQVSETKTSFINDGLIYERRAIIRKHLDNSIRHARDTGITKKWVAIDFALVRKARVEWEHSLPEDVQREKNKREENGPKPLSFRNCASSIYILLLGLGISSIGFIYERVQFLLEKLKFQGLVRVKVQKGRTRRTVCKGEFWRRARGRLQLILNLLK